MNFLKKTKKKTKKDSKSEKPCVQEKLDKAVEYFEALTKEAKEVLRAKDVEEASGG